MRKFLTAITAKGDNLVCIIDSLTLVASCSFTTYISSSKLASLSTIRSLPSYIYTTQNALAIYAFCFLCCVKQDQYYERRILQYKMEAKVLNFSLFIAVLAARPEGKLLKTTEVRYSCWGVFSTPRAVCEGDNLFYFHQWGLEVMLYERSVLAWTNALDYSALCRIRISTQWEANAWTWRTKHKHVSSFKIPPQTVDHKALKDIAPLDVISLLDCCHSGLVLAERTL